jgi:hypothetical protein
MGAEPSRYVDSGVLIGRYAQSAWVECPGCSRAAFVSSPSKWGMPFVPSSAFVRCQHCSFSDEYPSWYGTMRGHAFVGCPRCQKYWDEHYEWSGEPSEEPDRFGETVCPTCSLRLSFAITWKRVEFAGKPVDPAFGLPLWLQRRCCGHILWAYNREHLETLRAYVGAKHRQRYFHGKWSMIARLPSWIKSAKNRESVLRCIDRLDQEAEELGHSA